MSTETHRDVVHASLLAVAPEADLETLDPRARLREALDLDSMDFLRFVQELHQRLGVDVPELDYGRLETLEGCLAYLAARTA